MLCAHNFLLLLVDTPHFPLASFRHGLRVVIISAFGAGGPYICLETVGVLGYRVWVVFGYVQYCT